MKWLIALTQPLLGALPFSQKKRLEEYVGDPRFFTAGGATGANALQNMVVYPIVLAAIGAVSMHKMVFSNQLNNLIVLGVFIAVGETLWRMREGLRAMPLDQIVYRGTLYGLPLAAVFGPITRTMARSDKHGTIAVDGFHGGTFEEKLERERRYGEVYTLEDKGNGYLLRLEFPRRVPPSALKEELGIPDEMPGYDYELALRNGFFVVRGRVVEESVRKLAAISPAFPPDFTTNVELPAPISTFKHRIRDRVLEVVLLKN